VDKWKELAKEDTQSWISCLWTSEKSLQKSSLKFEWAVFERVKRPCKRAHSNLSELILNKRKDLAKEVTQIWVSWFWTSEKTLQKKSLKFEWAVCGQEKRACKRGHSNLSELLLNKWKDLAKEVTQIWVSCFWTREKTLQKRSLKFEWAVFGTREKSMQKRTLKFEWAVFEQVKRPCKRAHSNLSELFLNDVKRPCKRAHSNLSELFLNKRKELAKELTQIWVSWFWTSEKTLQKRSLKFEWAVFEQEKRPCKRGHSNLSELILNKWKDLAKEVTQIWVSWFWTSEKTLQKRSLKFEWAVFEQEKRACKSGHSKLNELFVYKWKELAKELTQIWAVFGQACKIAFLRLQLAKELTQIWVSWFLKRGHSNLCELFFDKWNYFAKEVTQIWVSCKLNKTKRACKRGHSNLN
jgi:hypothetical protein